MIGINESKLGETSFNTNGTPMKIVKFRIQSDITVEFQDDHKHTVNTTYQNFKRKCISNPYDRTVYGVGYLGVGKYKAKINNKLTNVYNVWSNMLDRCYCKKDRHKYPAYYGICTVCDEWLNFQVFAEWYESHLYYLHNERVEIDKDILVSHNKIYSPDNCLLVPQSINLLFSRHNAKDERELPTGIYKHKSGKYTAVFTYKGVTNRFTKIETLEEACQAYKDCKKRYLIKAAEDYKQYIPPQLYEALYNCEVRCDY